MKRSTFLAIAAAIGVLFGLAMLMMTEQFVGMWGLTLTEGGVFLGRSLGAFLFSIGIVNWIVRNAPDSIALDAILYGNLAVHLLTGALDLFATTTGVINAQGWGAVVMHLVLGGGFAYYLFVRKPS